MTQRRTWWRLATWRLGLALALGPLALGAEPDSKEQVVAYNRRTFKVPVTIPARDLPRLKEIQLLAATSGGTYQLVGTTTPDRPYFMFTAKTDGEYWFAARTVDRQGRMFPSDNDAIEANMRVTIDTKKPELSIEPRARRGNIASIAWDVTDEALDLDTLAFEYQVDNSAEWVPITIRRPARVGVESWDAGTAEPLKVRGSVADRAKNRQVVTVALPGGGVLDQSPAPPESADPNVPPPIGTFASTDVSRSAAGLSPKRTRTPASSNAGSYDPYSAGATSGDGPTTATDPAPTPGPAADPAPPPILVASPKFALQYAVDDAGPNGPEAVELFVTNDGGQTWTSRGKDPDRTSPFAVDLGGEGRYGLKLVARSAADQGDRPPVPGETPQTAVEVDSTGPTITIERPQLAGNRLLITWHSSDPHPVARPVMISIRADAPDAKWQFITPTPVENTGQYSWLISSRCPAKIHVRIDVRDALNNLSFAETTESGPVIVDRSKPKSKILGLDTGNARGAP